jgi:hypothetical protein
MSVRKFGEKTQKDYIRHVKDLTIFSADRPRRPWLRICAAINCI